MTTSDTFGAVTVSDRDGFLGLHVGDVSFGVADRATLAFGIASSIPVALPSGTVTFESDGEGLVLVLIPHVAFPTCKAYLTCEQANRLVERILP